MMDQKTGWHLEKSVSVGHIITTLSIAFSALWWASTVETRLAVNTQKIAAQDLSTKRQEDAAAVIRQEFRADFDRLNKIGRASCRERV